VPAKPTVRVELKPMPQASGESPSAHEPSAASHSAQASPLAASQVASSRPGRTITLPALVPFLTIIVALAAIVGTWTVAYRKGESSKEQELQPLLQATRPPVLEPGTTGLSTSPQPAGTNRTPARDATVGSSSASSGPSGRPVPANAQNSSPAGGGTPAATTTFGSRASLDALEASPPAAAAILTTAGWKTAEVRQNGLNYLNIATLRHKDAASALFFLGQNGVEAFAVPLASSSSRGNTSPPVTYRVFVLPGITSEQYRARQSVMTNLEASVARLGRQWSRDQKGASDFRSPQWTKFDDK
jgi:hypothetical protein